MTSNNYKAPKFMTMVQICMTPKDKYVYTKKASEFRAKVQFVEVYGKEIEGRDIDTQIVTIRRNKDKTFTFHYIDDFDGKPTVRNFHMFHKTRLMFFDRPMKGHPEHGAYILSLDVDPLYRIVP
jgi:hypothetical protein